MKDLLYPCSGRFRTGHEHWYNIIVFGDCACLHRSDEPTFRDEPSDDDYQVPYEH